MQRLVIFAMKRTGSNHLVALLKSHPQIQCYGELFRNKYNVAKFLPTLAERYVDFEMRKAEPVAYLDAVEDQVPGEKTLWGFKFFAEHGVHLVPEFIRDARYRVVVLKRSNILAQYSSEIISRRTGQSVALESEEIKEQKIRFREDRFRAYRQSMADYYDVVRDACWKHDRECFLLDYCDLNDACVQSDLLSFLGVEPHALTSRHAKRNSSRIDERFLSPEQVRKHLDEIGKPEWCFENA